MDWFRQVNSYCERTDASYWSEPVNAVTNLAFILAALYGWRLSRRADDRGGLWLSAVLFVIGVGSYLFHTHAQIWAMLADTLPILVFILSYLFLATVRFFRLPLWAGAIAVVAYFPYSRLVTGGLEPLVGGLNGSLSYVPVPILIAGYAAALWRRRPETARGLLIGVGILALSLLFRTIDEAVCPGFPLGTHFLWHLLNGLMLGWMIRVMVADRATDRGGAGLARPGAAR
jgi:hypothetical protein